MTELHAVKNLFYNLDTSKSLPASYAHAIKELFVSLNAEEGVSKLLKVIQVFRFYWLKRSIMFPFILALIRLIFKTQMDFA